MAWKDSGDDRIRRYRAYRELEEAHQAALARIDELETQLRAKDATIRQMALELHQALTAFELPIAEPVATPESVSGSAASSAHAARETPSGAGTGPATEKPDYPVGKPWEPRHRPGLAKATAKAPSLPLKDRLTGGKR